MTESKIKTQSIRKRTVKFKQIVESIEKEKHEMEQTSQAKTSNVYDLSNSKSIVDLKNDKQSSNDSINKIRKNEIVTIFVILFIVLSFFVIERFVINNSDNNISVDEEIIETIPDKVYMPTELKDEWLKNKMLNDDYVGNIVFDSGLIDIPVVQATDVYDSNGNPYVFYTEDGLLANDLSEFTGNDVYIWTNWRTGEYDYNGDGGAAFMDFRSNLSDQNIIIYGHHFARDYDPNGNKIFTPLDLLLSEENYDKNKSLKLILNDEIREYVVTNVFMVDVDDENDINVLRKNMNEDFSGNPDPDFFNSFIEYMNKKTNYDISENLSNNDRILTLITCIQHQPQYREVIVCKEMNTTIYDSQ